MKFNIDTIWEEAEKRFSKYQRGGARGQAVVPQDGLEYWYALVAYEQAMKDYNIKDDNHG